MANQQQPDTRQQQAGGRQMDQKSGKGAGQAGQSAKTPGGQNQQRRDGAKH